MVDTPMPEVFDPVEDMTENVPSIYDETVNRKVMKPELATPAAERYHFALGDKSPGQPQIFQELIGGYEKELTERMMNLDRMEENSKRQQRLIDFVNRGRESELPLSQDEYNELVSLPEEQANNILSNPDTYFSKKQAKATIDKVWNSASRPEADPQQDQVLQKHLAKQYQLQKYLQEVNERVQNESTLTKVVNTVEQFVPVFSWWNTTDALKNAPTSSYLRGTNLREQSDYVWMNPDVDGTVNEVRQAVEEIYEANPYDALAFLQGVLYVGEDDEVFSNLMQGAEIASGFGAGLAVQGVRTFAKVASKAGTSVPGMLDASGQVADAAFQQTITELRLAAKFDTGAAQSSFNDLAGNLHPIMNPDAVVNVANSRFGVQYKNNLVDMMKNQSEAMVRAGLDAINIARLEPGTPAYNTAMAETQRLFSEQFPSTNGAIVQIRPITSATNRLTNTDHIAVGLGRTDGTLFATIGEAQANASLYELSDFTIASRGREFYIEVSKAVDETLPSVRDALYIDTVTQPTPMGLANRFLGALRTKDELLPEDLVGDLKVATSGAQQFANLLAGVVSNRLTPLRKESRKNLLEFLEWQRDTQPMGSKKTGFFSRDIAEFETQWQAQTGRLPREDEASAYFTYVQVNDAEYFFNNLNIYKGKSRLGFENFHFEQIGVRPKIAPSIEGRKRSLEQFFFHKEDANLLIWDDARGGQPATVRKNELTPAARTDVEDMVNNQGYTLVQLSQYGDQALRQYPLVTIPDVPIQYVLVRNHSSRPLSLKQIPYKGGAHQEYATRFFISQPKIRASTNRGARTHFYSGDLNAFAFETRAQAARYTEALEEARQIYLRDIANGTDVELRAFFQTQTRLPFDYQKFVSQFNTNNGPFDPNTPFYTRSRGATVHSEHKLDRNYENFTDTINTPHNAFNEDVNLRFAQERDEPLNTIVNRGSAQQPYHSFERARRIDPYTSMARAARNVAKGRYLDDLKIKSAERFVREFADVLAGNAEDVQRYPMRALMNDSINRNHPNADRVAAARNYKRSLIEFFNTKDDNQYAVDSIVNRVGEFAIRNLGDARGRRVLEAVEPHLISTIEDPTKFFRAIAFHTKMGFFNPKQWFMQGQGVFMTAAMEGMPRATKGMAAAQLMRPLHMRNNDKILDAAADMAATLGWDRGHFRESYLALQRTGFQNVGGEYGVLDDFLNTQVIQSGASKALDGGLMFFRDGEKFNRLTAWNAAYLRWRDVNPLGAFDDRAVKEVLNRADLLTVNMTRASNATWNQGWASIPTQFFSYQARMMDLMLGGRIDATAKARLMMTYSALYGVPLGVGGTTVGLLWPIHEAARQAMIEYGINVDDPAWDAFTNGLPQAALNFISGGEVNPALASTFGPGGMSWLKEFIYGGEDSSLSLLAGPSGDTVYNIGKEMAKLARAGYLQSEPLLMSLWGTTVEDSEVLPLTIHDFTPLLNNITTMSNASKAYWAATTGTYFTKNNIDIIDEGYDSKWNAFFTGILGANPQDVNDFYSKVNVKNGIQELQESQRKEARTYYRMALDPNISDADRMMYLKRAKAALIGLTESQKQRVLQQSVRGLNATAIDRIDNDLKNANKDRQSRWYEMLKGDE